MIVHRRRVLGNPQWLALAICLALMEACLHPATDTPGSDYRDPAGNHFPDSSHPEAIGWLAPVHRFDGGSGLKIGDTLTLSADVVVGHGLQDASWYPQDGLLLDRWVEDSTGFLRVFGKMTWKSAGRFRVSLRITDLRGNSVAATETVTVDARTTKSRSRDEWGLAGEPFVLRPEPDPENSGGPSGDFAWDTSGTGEFVPVPPPGILSCTLPDRNGEVFQFVLRKAVEPGMLSFDTLRVHTYEVGEKWVRAGSKSHEEKWERLGAKVFAGRIWLFGGVRNPNTLIDLERFDTIWTSRDGEDWAPLEGPSGSFPNSGAFGAVMEERLFIYSWENPNRTIGNWISTADGSDWRTELRPPNLSPSSSILSVDGRNWLFNLRVVQSNRNDRPYEVMEVWNSTTAHGWHQISDSTGLHTNFDYDLFSVRIAPKIVAFAMENRMFLYLGDHTIPAREIEPTGIFASNDGTNWELVADPNQSLPRLSRPVVYKKRVWNHDNRTGASAVTHSRDAVNWETLSEDHFPGVLNQDVEWTPLVFRGRLYLIGGPGLAWYTR